MNWIFWFDCFVVALDLMAAGMNYYSGNYERCILYIGLAVIVMLCAYMSYNNQGYK